MRRIENMKNKLEIKIEKLINESINNHATMSFAEEEENASAILNLMNAYKILSKEIEHVSTEGEEEEKE